MPHKKLEKKKRKPLGMEAIVEPGIGALYARGAWMKKMNALRKRKHEQAERNQSKQKFRP
ncbi:MAG: hypothetical protein WBV70_04555 [Candidatus Bathyarchaeia archaeon]